MGQINEITQDMLAELIPEMAIIVFANRESRRFYLERRDIADGYMGAGTPLTEACITEIFDAISSVESNVIHGRIPENMLYADGRCGRERYVWYDKPMRRKLFFTKDAGMPDGEMWVPGLLYEASDTKLSVYAFKGNKPKDKLYRAPFFNVYADGKVCLGSAKVEKPADSTWENIIRYWEKMFWGSEFAHLISDNPIRGNLSTVTKQCIQDGCRFPEEELKVSTMNLKNLLR